MTTPVSHHKRNDLYLNLFNTTDLAFQPSGGNLVSNTISLRAASGVSIFGSFDASVTVNLVDKDASDAIGEDVILATATGTSIQIHKGLLRLGSFNNAYLQIVGSTTTYSVYTRVTNEFGAPST